jgi:hypothetical protein
LCAQYKIECGSCLGVIAEQKVGIFQAIGRVDLASDEEVGGQEPMVRPRGICAVDRRGVENSWDRPAALIVSSNTQGGRGMGGEGVGVYLVNLDIRLNA